jgi:hypothetical protein
LFGVCIAALLSRSVYTPPFFFLSSSVLLGGAKGKTHEKEKNSNTKSTAWIKTHKQTREKPKQSKHTPKVGVAHRRADAVQPRAQVVVARDGEGSARQLLCVQSVCWVLGLWGEGGLTSWLMKMGV